MTITDSDTEQPRDPEQPIAWRAVPQDTEVRSSDGEHVGHIVDLLGSDDEDIFHGIVVRLSHSGHEVFVPADDVTLMTPSHLDVAYTADELKALPEHTQDRQFELGWVGFLRKHLGWRQEKDR